jgi:hypothetical protein
MANTFPTASTVIRKLGQLGIGEVFPSHQFTDRPGFFVSNGLAHTFGPSIHVHVAPELQHFISTSLLTILEEAGWNVTVDRTVIIRVNSIPKKGR